MNARDYAAILERDLATFDALLDRYGNEADLWKESPAATNSPGTLALHVAGNLRHFVGAILGGSDYVRDRDAEFSRRGAPRAELQEDLRVAVAEVHAALDGLDPAVLAREYPVDLPGGPIRTELFLLHLCTHLSYHLGQADGHRRWVAGDGASLRAVPIPSEPKEG